MSFVVFFDVFCDVICCVICSVIYSVIYGVIFGVVYYDFLNILRFVVLFQFVHMVITVA